MYQLPGDGQCFRACLATLLGLEIEQVPRMKVSRGRWLMRLRRFCRMRGYDLIHTDRISFHSPAPMIVGGPVHRRGSWHAIIVKNGRILHDPFPGERQGLSAWRDYYLLVPLKPNGTNEMLRA